MFLTLLAVTLGVAFATAAVIARVFRDPVDRILSVSSPTTSPRHGAST